MYSGMFAVAHNHQIICGMIPVVTVRMMDIIFSNKLSPYTHSSQNTIYFLSAYNLVFRTGIFKIDKVNVTARITEIVLIPRHV